MELSIAQSIASWRTAIELFFRTKAGKQVKADLANKEQDVFALLLEALMPIPSEMDEEERTTIESWKKINQRTARSTFFVDMGDQEPSDQDKQRFDDLVKQAHAQVVPIEKIAKQQQQAETYGSIRTPMVPMNPEMMLPRSERMTMPHYYDPEYLRAIAEQVEAETGRKILHRVPRPSDEKKSESKPEPKQAIPPPPRSVPSNVRISSASDTPPKTKTSAELADEKQSK